MKQKILSILYLKAGLLRLLVSLGIVFAIAFSIAPAARAADSFTYSQTSTANTTTQSGDSGTFYTVAAYDNTDYFTASSTLHWTIKIKRDMSTFSSAAMGNHGNLGPSIAFLSTVGASTCSFRYFFTQTDINLMNTAYVNGGYATFTFDAPQYSYNATTCSYTPSASWRFGIVGLNQTSNTGGTGTFAASYTVQSSASNNFATSYMLINATTPQDTEDTTHINLVTPYDAEPVPSSGYFLATASQPWTYEASGYILPSDGDLTDVDEDTGIRVRWTISNGGNCIDVICAANANAPSFGSTRVYYSGTGYSVFGSQRFNVSTTTAEPLPTNYYNMTTEIVRPTSVFGFTGIFGISFGYTTLAKKQTQFKVGTTNTLQDLLHSGTAIPNTDNGGLTATTTAALAASCNMISFSFNMFDCLTYLFIPSLSDFSALIDYAQLNIFNRAPWGYGTRMISILTNSATSTASTDLPTFVFTFPSNLNTGIDPLTFDMQDMLDQGSTTINGITDPISGKSVREITEPYILLIIAISAMIIVFHDIMGMGRHTINYARK